MVLIFDREDDLESDYDFEEIPQSKKSKANYDKTWRFQNEWIVKLVQAKSIRSSDGKAHLMKCTMCFTFKKKTKILGLKWDTLQKHEGRRKTTFSMPKYKVKVGEWYI